MAPVAAVDAKRSIQIWIINIPRDGNGIVILGPCTRPDLSADVSFSFDGFIAADRRRDDVPPDLPNSDLFAQIRPNWNDASTFNPRAVVSPLSLLKNLRARVYFSRYVFISFVLPNERDTILVKWMNWKDSGQTWFLFRFEPICLDRHAGGARLQSVAFEIRWVAVLYVVCNNN